MDVCYVYVCVKYNGLAETIFFEFLCILFLTETGSTTKHAAFNRRIGICVIHAGFFH